jgi:hypothetical protein
MRKILLPALVIALALSFTASAAAPGAAATAPPEPDVDGLFVLTLTEPELCSEDAAAADEIARLFQPVVWHCPFGAPHCRRHDNCDAYCGDPRFGHCFSNGCCGCSG